MINRFRLIAVGICFYLLPHATWAQENFWSLEKCIDYAIQNNIRIKQYELDEESAVINRDIAIGNFLPGISVNGNHSWTIADQPNLVTNAIEKQTLQGSSIGAAVNVDIYNGLQNQNLLVKSRLAHLASQYRLQKMKEDIALNVINSYLQIIFNKELVRTNKVQLEYDESQATRTQELVEAGVVPAGDLLEANATVAVATQRLIVSQNELVMARLSLAQLLQISDYEAFDVIDKDYDVAESAVLIYTPDEIKSRAFEALTIVKNAETEVNIADRDLKISRGAFLPKLTAFYNFGTNINYQDRIVGMQSLGTTSTVGYVEGTNQRVVQNNTMGIIGGPDSFFSQFDKNKTSSFGLSLSIPVFQGFSVRNNVKLTKLKLRQIQNEREVVILNLEQLVFKAYTDTESALKTYEASIVSLKARTQSLEYAKERYAVGLINVFELNQNQNLFVTAQSDLLKSKYDYIFKTKILEYYFGIPLFKN